jgi:replicative DNA helicase
MAGDDQSMNAHNPIMNVEAEQQLLGALLLNGDKLDRVSDILEPEHFAEPLHGRVYDLIRKRVLKGHLASPTAIAPLLMDDITLKDLGGLVYLIRLAGAAITSASIRDYAKVVIEQAARRGLKEAALGAVDGISGGVDAQEVKAALLTALQRLPEPAGEESSVSFLAAMTRAVEKAASAYQGDTSTLKTGIFELDDIIKGLEPGDLCLVGGTTSMGKTSLALEMASKAAIDRVLRVGFWSLEMSDVQLATRLASARSRIPYAALRDAGTMMEADFRKWTTAAQDIHSAPIRIVPKYVRDLAAGHAALRRVKREFDGCLDVVIVDYAQLIRGPGKSRFEQMTEVSIGLKALAGMLECPVIALVQLDRTIGDRDDKRPFLSDIKESGQFENDADQVIFCHREAYYLERQGPKADKSGNISTEAMADWKADLAACKNHMELIVRKNRHGKLDSCTIGFHDATNRFWSLSDDRGGFE